MTVLLLLFPKDLFVVCKGPRVTLKAHPWGTEKKDVLGSSPAGRPLGTESLGVLRSQAREIKSVV